MSYGTKDMRLFSLLMITQKSSICTVQKVCLALLLTQDTGMNKQSKLLLPSTRGQNDKQSDNEVSPDKIRRCDRARSCGAGTENSSKEKEYSRFSLYWPKWRWKNHISPLDGQSR